MIFWEYDDKKSREESGISKLGKNTLHGLLIITDTIIIMKLTHRFLGSDNRNPRPQSRS